MPGFVLKQHSASLQLLRIRHCLPDVIVSIRPGDIKRACFGKDCKSFHDQLTPGQGWTISKSSCMYVCTIRPLKVLVHHKRNQ
jgi:hypothetical protein